MHDVWEVETRDSIWRHNAPLESNSMPRLRWLYFQTYETSSFKIAVGFLWTRHCTRKDLSLRWPCTKKHARTTEGPFFCNNVLSSEILNVSIGEPTHFKMQFSSFLWTTAGIKLEDQFFFAWTTTWFAQRSYVWGLVKQHISHSMLLPFVWTTMGTELWKCWNMLACVTLWQCFKWQCFKSEYSFCFETACNLPNK